MKKASSTAILVITTLLLLNQNKTIFACSASEAPTVMRTGPIVAPPMNQDQASELTCGICWSTADSLGNEKMVILPCHPTHIYHKKCLSDWFKRNINCPLCKRSFPSPRILALLKEHCPEEIIAIQQAVTAAVSDLEQNPELKKEFLQAVTELEELLKTMPIELPRRSLWERYYNPRTARDWMCHACPNLACGCLWFSAELFFTIGLILVEPSCLGDKIWMSVWILTCVADGIISLRNLRANRYVFDYVGRYGIAANVIEALVSVIQGLKLCLRNHQEHAHEH